MIYILISIIITLISILYCINLKNNIHKINQNIDEENNQIKQFNKQLLKEKEAYQIQYNDLCKDIKVINNLIDEEQLNYNKLKEDENNIIQQINALNETAKNIYKEAEESAKYSYNKYCEDLDRQKLEAKKGYDNYEELLINSYSNIQKDLIAETAEIQEELEKIRASRAAAIQAQLREKEIEENKDDFRLDLDGKALGDIKILKSIQNQISNPIVIDKIIWSNYFQPIAKVKFPKILGKSECCGIYKLTSLVTGEIYIGQSKTVCDRFKEHCKNALGIGSNTARNKLYKAIQRDGLENYTFELLEECEPKYLDEKEKYYITLYNSCDFGLNSTQGNN